MAIYSSHKKPAPLTRRVFRESIIKPEGLMGDLYQQLSDVADNAVCNGQVISSNAGQCEYSCIRVQCYVSCGSFFTVCSYVSVCFSYCFDQTQARYLARQSTGSDCGQSGVNRSGGVINISG